MIVEAACGLHVDELPLTRQLWRHPDHGTDNYWRPDVALDQAAELLVTALWCARGCSDPERYAISIAHPGRGGTPTLRPSDVLQMPAVCCGMP